MREQPRATDESDESLIARIGNGDRQALGDLYDRYVARLLGFARWIGLRNTDAQDIVHDIFLEIWRSAGDFDPSRGSLSTWISIRLRFRIIDHLRKTKRERILAAGDMELLASPSETPGSQERRLILRRGLNALTPNQRQVVILAFLEGFSYDEIAQHLAIPFGTVKSRLVSALARLREEAERSV